MPETCQCCIGFEDGKLLPHQTDLHIFHKACHAHSQQEVEALQQQVAELRAALRKYGLHDESCSIFEGGDCKCGLDAALGGTG